MTDPKIVGVGLRARDLYKQDAKFRVVKEGARLEGLVYFGKSAWSGWSRPLVVGEILTCTGWQMGWGSDNIKQATFTGESIPEGASYVTVWPHSGMWQPFPMAGYLELVEEDSGD